MTLPPPPLDDEPARLAALYELALLDTPPDSEFDDLVRLASYICGTPIAALSLLDTHRQWFKAIIGLQMAESARNISFCTHAIRQMDLMIVPDTQTDLRFLDNPLVLGEPNIRFYAGAPLITDDGYAIGTLCVIDRVPRQLSAEQEDALCRLSRRASSHLQAARRNSERERLIVDMERLSEERVRTEQSLRASHDALKQSQARLAEAQRVAQIGSWEFDIDSAKITWSDALFHLFGMDPDEGAPSIETLMPRYHPHDRAMHEAITARALEDGRPYKFDIRILRHDGSVRWTHAVGQGERDASGRVVRLFGTLMDIHQRKAMEESVREQSERLRQNEAALRAVLESAPVILYATDAEGKITLSEGTGITAMGLKPGEAIGRSIFEFSGGDRKVEAATRRALAGEDAAFDVRVYDVYLHTVLRPIRNHDGTFGGIIGVCFDITERRKAEQQLRDQAVVLQFQNEELAKVNAELEALAITDGLTGLRNHRAFQERLAEEVARAARYDTPLSLILLDVDHFKRYNDTFGHPAGDGVIRTVSRVLQECARESDLVARYGGEEFVLILPQTDAEGANVHAEHVRAAIERGSWHKRPVTASLGVATLHPGEIGGAALIARADEALYQSKAAGRNRVTGASRSVTKPML